MRTRPALAVCGLLTLLFTLPGCLDAEEGILGRYDGEKDEFVFLNLYQRIGGTDARDADYLADLWKNRDHVLTPPIPNIFGKAAVLRLSKDQFAPITLGNRPGGIVAKSSAGIDLDSIHVMPGTFFLRGKDALCYYDQVAVPGKVIDQLIPMGLKQAAPDALEQINQEMTRRKNGGKASGWEELRAKAVEAITPPPAMPASQPAGALTARRPDPPEGVNDPQRKPNGLPAASGNYPAGTDPRPAVKADVDPDVASNPLRALSDESLKALHAAMTGAATDGKGLLSRDKQTFRLSLPLTADDTKQALLLNEAVRAELKKKAAMPGADESLLWRAKLLDLFDVRAGGAGGVEVSLDASRLFKGMEQAENLTKALKPVGDSRPAAGASYRKPTPAEYHDMAAAARAKGLPIDEALTVEQVLRAFDAGTLKAFASELPVTPGEGLAGQAPAEVKQ